MKKLLMLGLVAGAMLSVSACSNPDHEQKDDLTSAPLPAMPAASAGKDSAAVAAEQAEQELSAVNATKAIKKMQPSM
ncbi:hypothetical protein F0P96_14465 [Hymenobacter busanensis]|uniref:Uncharacterized protein n=1 Tax=Hymenobacter busanensis TaxID=2607656 RepID=A0A7L4ZZC0_9BACT|nr:hypothetical protein [Hymenobacter busanensis]KAA9331444.1 hypothetical protein F0P96_14465 [Hymenobacter busanensis]QHJ08598.1 hypothetical protein GUY19_15395 [Hymenobacter busanensis]